MIDKIHCFVTVLHGGLGNQLFQYFFARIKSKQVMLGEVRLVIYFLSRYKSPRSIELIPLVEQDLSADVQFADANFLLKARLPKVINRFHGRELALRIPGYGTIIDGYFQELRHYQNCPANSLNSELMIWRSTLSKRLSLYKPGKGRITHIRLGDFFNDQEAARSFAARQLLAINAPTDLITDQEDVLAGELGKLNLAHSVRLLPSSDMSAWDLMALMCCYESISTNGSTLAFWAAVMRRAQLQTTNPEHQNIWHLMMQADRIELTAR